MVLYPFPKTLCISRTVNPQFRLLVPSDHEGTFCQIVLLQHLEGFFVAWMLRAQQKSFTDLKGALERELLILHHLVKAMTKGQRSSPTAIKIFECWLFLDSHRLAGSVSFAVKAPVNTFVPVQMCH